MRWDKAVVVEIGLAPLGGGLRVVVAHPDSPGQEWLELLLSPHASLGWPAALAEAIGATVWLRGDWVMKTTKAFLADEGADAFPIGTDCFSWTAPGETVAPTATRVGVADSALSRESAALEKLAAPESESIIETVAGREWCRNIRAQIRREESARAERLEADLRSERSLLRDAEGAREIMREKLHGAEAEIAKLREVKL